MAEQSGPENYETDREVTLWPFGPRRSGRRVYSLSAKQRDNSASLALA
jgi:hypothetical protein